MTRTLKFYKEELGRWYVDLPEWEGDKGELEMVAGADTMLDIYAQQGETVTLIVSDSPLEYGDSLIYSGNDDGVYNVSTLHGQPYDFNIWLCPVTQFVFGDYPSRIYVKKTNAA